ncbi:hypothetical protein GDN83_12075 [Gordonia jinghuaiqii]|uniref:Uncharacterized protein n=1 Tax=Gordonia jinghuaiqii TaxID=2758710 RepID=A0A7D7R4K5_9ACTN|nr:hypothetical protein [Gordonia jinghuaiqii]MCR5978453.1 hypothetical protein [Gordonia jinghuaiqii]QMT02792.1 hypothetical protein H1R19_06560 [Gordonia jinghuaiqii]
MKRPSIAPAAITFGVGALALIIALVLSFVPFSSAGTVEPTPAFRAQKSLDEVLFKMATSPAAKYTGKVDYKYANAVRGQGTVEFTDLIVTTSNTAEGTISLGSEQGEYRQIGNSPFISAPSALWETLLVQDEKTNLDAAPLDNKWASTRFTGLPRLGTVLGPDNLAGDIGNTELDSEPQLGAELPAPNKGTPDARHWPTSDPPIEFIGDNKVKLGTWEVTFDPATKNVTHVKGQSEVEAVTYDIDASVSLQPADQAQKVFANQRALVSDLVSVPAPGLWMKQPVVTSRQVGACTPAACAFDYIVQGSPYAEDVTGHFNYGFTLNFAVGNRPPGAVGGECKVVLRVDFGRNGTTRCTATNLPPATNIGSRYTYSYLAFLDSTEAALNDLIDNNEKQTNTEVVYVRTGNKEPQQARFGASVTGLPSYYAIKRGDYLFDGIGTDGNMHVTFGDGYKQHIVGVGFDPAWEGTEVLKKQMSEQVGAAGDAKVVYFTAEPETATALRLLIASENQSDNISAYHID